MTRKQRDLLFFICRELDSKSVSPSYEQMMLAVKLGSKSGSHRVVMALEKLGFIYRVPNCNRSIEPTDKGWSAYHLHNGPRCAYCGR